MYVRQLEKVAGPYDPVTLRWTSTPAHVLLYTGCGCGRFRSLALVIDEQRAVLGAGHPDTRQSLRVLQHHTDSTAPIQPIDAWGR